MKTANASKIVPATRKPGRPRKIDVDGFAQRGRRRNLTNKYSHISLRPDDIGRLNEVGRDMARRMGTPLSARQIVVYLANDYLKDHDRRL